MNAEPALKLVETTRYCKDCRWCDRKFPYARCSAPQNVEHTISLVTGEPERKLRDEFCSVGRKYDLEDTCGESGRWFEPRTGEGEAG